MPIKVEKISEPQVLGEAPHWDENQQCLFFVDIIGNTINKYVPATGLHTSTKVDGRVGCIIPVDCTTDQFLLGVERKFVIVRWDGCCGTPATLIRVVAEVDVGTKNRINDAKADPRGRVYGGTMGHEEPLGNVAENEAGFYRLDCNRATKLEEGISISNGLAWDLKEKAFYYIDSLERKIRRYDYDVHSGEISNLTYIFDLEKHDLPGSLDGMTIDTDGNLWIANFNGAAVLKVDPKCGKILQKVPIPAQQVTSVTFGGPNYDMLFVTTASMDIEGPQLPPSGATFLVTGLGVKGLPNKNYIP